MNNRSAAGLRRSAIAERIRLREEWSELKGTDGGTTLQSKQTNVLAKKHGNIFKNNKKANIGSAKSGKKKFDALADKENMAHVASDVLRGVVALVDVGAESRALALRAALTALGASVVPSWNPLVTHLIWSQGGCRITRAKARVLACKLVSPLWVEACAASARRLPEQAFPAAARASDLPSPRTLRQMLKKADMENIPLADLFADSKEDEDPKQMRLRMSSDTEQDTSADTSHDKSADKTDIECRVNTAPRRALPKSLSKTPQPEKKSRRKLFTQKEAEVTGTTSEDDSDPEKTTKAVPLRKPVPHNKLTQQKRRDLARAERMAKKILATCATRVNNNILPATNVPRIVLTGMNRRERQAVSAAVRALSGHIQKLVTRRTTHVLLGSCRDDDPDDNHGFDITGVTSHALTQPTVGVQWSGSQKARTLNALVGAARGCRVLYAKWATDSALEKRWAHHAGYEVPHLRKISQKARVERSALGRQRSEYVYDVFNGMRVFVSPNAEQKDAAIQLLTLCGAVVQDGGENQNGRQSTADFDITVGINEGEINSKWVFDSVAAARMRTTRRYVQSAISCTNLSTQMTDR